MRILVFHGYLLRGTGSNVYNARLAAALARGGATVDLLCQERRARELHFVDAIGTWVDGERRGEVGGGGRGGGARGAGAGHGLAAGHRAPAADVRRRPLRGLRGQAVPRVQR